MYTLTVPASPDAPTRNTLSRSVEYMCPQTSVPGSHMGDPCPETKNPVYHVHSMPDLSGGTNQGKDARRFCCEIRRVTCLLFILAIT